MSKFVSDATFSTYLTDDFNWRLKEITDLRKIAASVGDGYEVAARKAGIALLYAHWEGYIKFVGEAYVKYVAVRKLKIDLLVDEFLAVEISGILKAYSTTGGGLSSRLDLINEWRNIEQGRFRRFREKGVAIGGNLNYQRFSEICKLIRIDPKSVIKDDEYLDRNLLGVRNKIAHGESITVTALEFRDVSNFVIESMRNFRTETEYCVIKKYYMKR
jgi:hypothetical protein